MALISTDNLKKYFADKIILDGINFTVERGEKIGILGRNGAGKTTFLNILKGDDPYYEGDVAVAKSVKMVFLSQIPKFNDDFTVYDELLTNFRELYDLHKKILEVSIKIEKDEDAADEYDRLWHEYEKKGGTTYETELKKVLIGLNLENLKNRVVSTLSGGEKMRLNLAKILLSKADLIFLDEPTNHLDINSIKWLASYLKKFDGAVVLISHDRFLLDEVVKKIYELEYGKFYKYNGNYTKYKMQKEQNSELLQKEYRKKQEEIKKLQEYIKKYKAGNRATMAKSREKRLKKIEIVDMPSQFKYQVKLNFNGFKESSADVLRIKKMDKLPLFLVEDIVVRKGEKIALVGKNGAGKTTFFREIMRSSAVKWGHNVKIGYFDQFIKFENENISMIDYLNLYYDLDMFEAREYLGHFSFSGDDAGKNISVLSGGERARFKFLTIMLDAPNVILMDEPTNHLDIAFLEILEKALIEFEGTLIVVSHDLYFLKKIVNRLWVIKNGNFFDYKYDVARLIDELDFSEEEKKEKKNNNDYVEDKKMKNLKKKTERRIEQLEKIITETEKRIEKIEKEMHECGTNYEKLAELNEKMSNASEELDKYLKEWEEAESFLDKIGD